MPISQNANALITFAYRQIACRMLFDMEGSFSSEYICHEDSSSSLVMEGFNDTAPVGPVDLIEELLFADGVSSLSPSEMFSLTICNH